MTTESKGRYERPPLDNSRLIADLITVIKAGLAMMEAYRKGGITLTNHPEITFSSEVEERRVKGARVSDIVHVCVTFNRDEQAGMWAVSIFTRADAPVNTLVIQGNGADTERRLDLHPELAEALRAETFHGTKSTLLLIPGEE